MKMEELKRKAVELIGQIETTKKAGMLNKAAEAEKAVDMSARLMIGMLKKMEEMEVQLNG